MPRNESRTAGKRPMRAMTPQDKMDAIARVHAGESKAAVARDIGVPESTLRGWCKAEEKIRAQLNNVRTTGTYELTSSSDNSDNSRPGSSSRSTPTQNTMLSCTERGSEEPETGPAPKRMKLENNLVTSTTATATANAAAVAAAAAAINMNSMTPRTPTMGSETSAFFQPYNLYNLLAGDPKTLTLFNALMKGDILSFPNCPYTSPATNLLMDNNLHLQQSRTRNNGAMTNLLSTNNMLVNGRRRYNTTGLTSTMENPTKVTAKRQNSQSPNAERPSGSISQPPTNNRTSSPLSMPSTSANNGRVVMNTSAKSSKESSNKTLHDIISQLQQQQGAVPSGRECNMGEMISTNAMNNNNNNDHHVDNETTSSNTLPPGFSDMITYCTKLIDWLQAYGTPICTFQQVTHIKTILDSMTNWANSKEVQPKKKSNGTS